MCRGSDATVPGEAAPRDPRSLPRTRSTGRRWSVGAGHPGGRPCPAGGPEVAFPRPAPWSQACAWRPHRDRTDAPGHSKARRASTPVPGHQPEKPACLQPAPPGGGGAGTGQLWQKDGHGGGCWLRNSVSVPPPPGRSPRPAWLCGDSGALVKFSPADLTFLLRRGDRTATLPWQDQSQGSANAPAPRLAAVCHVASALEGAAWGDPPPASSGAGGLG